MAAHVFSCHYFIPQQVFRPTRLFSMLISGVHSDEQAGYAGDLGGENIAGQNEFSELRHQYYVWKNLLGRYDHVGFEHYRRAFFIDPATAPLESMHPQIKWWRAIFAADHSRAFCDTSPELVAFYQDYRAGFDDEACAAVEAWVSRQDIIVQRAYVNDGLEAQWKACFPHEFWDAIVSAVRETFAAMGQHCDIDIGVRTGYFNNMYIMRSELFDQYMTFLMHCSALIRQQVPYMFDRLLGHCAERIFSLWLFQLQMREPGLRLHQHPFLFSSEASGEAQPGSRDIVDAAARGNATPA